jgi:hypothetical protein
LIFKQSIDFELFNRTLPQVVLTSHSKNTKPATDPPQGPMAGF